MTGETPGPLPDMMPPMTNRAVFALQPLIGLGALLRPNATPVRWELVNGSLLQYEIMCASTDIVIPTRCRVVINPFAFAEKLLPPGNTLCECWLLPNGSLEFTFEGIDAPDPDGDELPRMVLMLGSDLMGHRETWLEKSAAPTAIKPDEGLLTKLRNLLNKHPGKDGGA